MKKTFLAVILVAAFASLSLAEAVVVRISFVGDIMTHAQQLEAARTANGYNFDPQFDRITPLLSADLLIGNFETTLPGAKGGYSGYPMFGTPDSLADSLAKIGFHVLLLANNHIYDKGVDGLHRTIDVLGEKGFLTTGAWKVRGDNETVEPLIMNVKGLKIGILNYSYGSNVPINEKMASNSHMNVIEEKAVVGDIRYLRDSGAEFVIATFHWGNEYKPKPSASQRKIAAACLDAGADLVVGAHPHILQPIEVLDFKGKTRMIAYSLGNFVSFQRTLPRERSVILSVEISSDNDDRVQIQKVELAPTYVEVAAEGGKRIARIIHASERKSIENEVLKFLGVSSAKDERGFYTIFKKQ